MVSLIVHVSVALLLAARPWQVLAQPSTGTAARFLPSGSMVKASLLTAIFSFNSPSPVIARLDGPATFRDKQVLPADTKLLGTAGIVKIHDRVAVTFTKAVLPDGTEIEISGVALSPDGSGGIQGTVRKHRDSIVASAALRGGILGAAALVAQTPNPVTAQAGQSLAEEAVREVDLAGQSVDVSVTVPAFTRLLVYLANRLVIPRPGEQEPAYGLP